MQRQERWVLAICMTILMSIAFGVSLHNVGTGICLGICMGVAFGLFGNKEDGGDE